MQLAMMSMLTNRSLLSLTSGTLLIPFIKMKELSTQFEGSSQLEVLFGYAKESVKQFPDNRISPKEVSLLIGDVFSTYYCLMMDESKIPYLLGMITRHFKESYRGDSFEDENNFVFAGLRRSFKTLMLALSPNPIKRTFALCRHLTNDSKLSEELVNNCCEIETTHQTLRLKKRLVEPTKEDLALYSFCFNPKLYTLIVDGLFNKKIKKHNSIVKKTAQFNYLHEHLGLSMAEIKYTFYEDVLNQICQMEFEPLNSVLEHIAKFLQLYFYCLAKTPEFMASKDDELKEFSERIVKLLASKFTKASQAAILRNLKNKLADYLKKDESNIARTQTATLSIGQEAEVGEDKNAKITQLFQKKKQSVINKIKKRQALFISEVEELAQEFINELKQEGEQQICSVSREPLTSANTYYMICQLHVSNLRFDIKLQTLKRMSTDTSLDSDILQAVLDKIDQMEKHSNKAGEVIVNSCGHFIKHHQDLKLEVEQMVYEPGEVACPLCKMPANVILPVFKSAVFENLWKCSNFKEEDNFNSTLAQFIKSSELGNEEDFEFGEKKAYDKQTLFDISDNLGLAQGFLQHYSIWIDQVTHNAERANTTIEWPPYLEYTTIFSSLLRYSELKGFAASIKDYGLIYHNMYLSSRISALSNYNNQVQVKSSAIEFVSMLQEILTQETDFTHVTSVLLSTPISLIANEKKLSEVFYKIVQLLIDRTLIFYLTSGSLEEHNPPLPSWDEVKYNDQHSDFINSMIKLLRMAALMKYIMQYPKLFKNKFFERIVQANLKGDYKEFDYLSIFLNVKIDTKSALANINQVKDMLKRVEEKETKEAPMDTEKIPDKGSDASRMLLKIMESQTLQLTFQQVPDRFYEYYSRNIWKSCEICHKKNNSVECLICGAYFCLTACNQNVHEKPIGYVGNAARHSLKYHNGTSLFIESDEGFAILYEGSRCYTTSNMFIDRYGQPVKESEFIVNPVRLKTYYLKPQVLEEMKQALTDQKACQIIVSKAIKEESIHERNYY